MKNNKYLMLSYQDYLLLETQTISQYLRELQIPPQVLKNIKDTIRQRLLTYQIFKNEGKQRLELFVNFFAYNGVVSWLKTRITRSGATYNSDLSTVDFSQDNNAGYLTGWASNINPKWQKWGDYIAAHIFDNRKMSMFNTPEYTDDKIDQDVEEWHHRLELKQAKPGGQGRPIIDLGKIGWPGWKWVSLDKGYCKEEAAAAGHCGNVNERAGDNIISLRDPENKVHVTCIINNKILGESKGRSNQKPSNKYHPAIIALLRSRYVQAIKGGGYKPENNFALNDLDLATRKDLLRRKPGLGSLFDYVMKGSKNLLKNLSNLFYEEFEKIIEGNILVVKTFTDLKDMYEYLKNTHGFERGSRHSHDFTWIDDYDWVDNITVSYDDFKSAIQYQTNMVFI